VANVSILLRTAEDTAIARITSDSKVSFEVDHIDDALGAGWSVLVYATCEHLDAAEVARAADVLPLEPWAGGSRDRWLRLRSRSVVGRSIESSS